MNRHCVSTPALLTASSPEATRKSGADYALVASAFWLQDDT